jgi:beta-glucosidase
MQWGNYNGFPGHTVTLYEGLKASLEPGYFVYNKVCDHTDESTLNIAQMLEAVQGADVVVFAGGISPRLEGEEMPVSVPGFRGGDRENIELPNVQRLAIKALKEAGKQIIFVNFSGSAVGLVPESENCDAILQAWYPGQAGGTAIAEVLTGKYNPSGRLPVTFYKSISQLPDYQDYSMKGRTYRYFQGNPLFCFGHGLSYTTFSYGKAKGYTPQIKVGSDFRFTIPLKNTGKLHGEEVVQVYIHRMSDLEGPIKSLKSFQHVSLQAGEKQDVEIKLPAESFECFDPMSNAMRILPGKYEILYGGSSDNTLLNRFVVTLQ